MSDLHARLAAAVTDIEAGEAMSMAVRERWPFEIVDIDAVERCDTLLTGDPAGWIGIGVLMMPAGWSVSRFWWAANEPRMAVALLTCADAKAANCERQAEGRANRPDCALVLAALKALSTPTIEAAR